MSNIGNKRIGAPKCGSIEQYFGPWGEVVEFEAFTCNHCQHIIGVPKGQLENRQRCFACDGLICQTCKRTDKRCFPAEALMELQEKIGRQARAFLPDGCQWRDNEVDHILRVMGVRR